MKKIFSLFILVFSLVSLLVLTSCEAQEISQEELGQLYFEEAHNHIISNHGSSMELSNYSGYEYDGEYIYNLEYYNSYYGEYYTYYVYFDYNGNRYCSYYFCESSELDFVGTYYTFRDYGYYFSLNAPGSSNNNDSNNEENVGTIANPFDFFKDFSLGDIFDNFDFDFEDFIEELFERLFGRFFK